MKLFRSRLYDCTVFHSRKNPVEHRFTYHYRTFCLDLDEVQEISKKSLLFGVQWLKPLRFVPSDSLFGSSSKTALDLKNSVIDYAKRMGLIAKVERVELLAHMRTLGYSYNPAAFFFGFDSADRMLFSIVEVTNTFKEKKAYFIPVHKENFDEATGEEKKLFYVSPFVELDSQFAFKIKRPAQKLSIVINSIDDTKSQETDLNALQKTDDKSSRLNHEKSSLIVHASLTGKSLLINDIHLLFLLIRFPLVTIGVMAKIHFQAAILYFKKVPYIKKGGLS